ncbi:hypothetical protein IST455A_04798 [Burkholderia multivorans]|uniref:Uncharacterized protein n=3 Tax=root TaxID=1 RepID=A0A9E7MNL9_9CAUD|nr:hypothetical protein Carl1_40 [Burkholderia phage Carl1]CAB5285389.1 hypothetical protein IST419_04837 [Burkholderia multivorans]VWB61805.1 hypothetical protein BPS26883_02909 [Burkholderia pseudomultivorans]CAB5293605.1 hypothetical protein IST495A_05258 [Burkholderia multivorans]CAB5302265.1 hypothetical protein IST455A_04798 [Burkholderia multivorans]
MTAYHWLCKVNEGKYTAMLRKKAPVTRSPRGVLSSKPVYMRLMPDERRALEELSTFLNRSTSSVARLIYLEGVERYRAKVTGPAAQLHASSFAGR